LTSWKYRLKALASASAWSIASESSSSPAPRGPLVACLAEGDRAKAAPFHQIQQLRPALFRDHLAEQGAQQLHLARKRIGRAAGAGGPGLGLHGGIARAWAVDRVGAG